jgi:uncharacterized protein
MPAEKYEKFPTILREVGSVVVAFSGEVDSTFLLKTAVETFGADHVLAVTADSETYPSSELEEAKVLMGVIHQVIETSGLAIPGYAENNKNRFYFCTPNDMKIILNNHNVILQELQNYGYKYITLDLIGYQSGSMNKVLEGVS